MRQLLFLFFILLSTCAFSQSMNETTFIFKHPKFNKTRLALINKMRSMSPEEITDSEAITTLIDNYVKDFITNSNDDFNANEEEYMYNVLSDIASGLTRELCSPQTKKESAEAATTASVEGQVVADNQVIYRFTDAKFNKFVKNELGKLQLGTYAYEGKIEYYVVNADEHLRRQLFTLYETDEYLYLLRVMSQNEIDKYAAAPPKGVLKWQEEQAICRVRKSKGYQKFLEKYITKLDIDDYMRTMITYARAPFTLKYNVPKDQLELLDVLENIQYNGNLAKDYLRCGGLSLSKKDKEEMQAAKEREEKRLQELRELRQKVSAICPFFEDKHVFGVFESWYQVVTGSHSYFYEGTTITQDETEVVYCMFVLCSESEGSSTFNHIYVVNLPDGKRPKYSKTQKPWELDRIIQEYSHIYSIGTDIDRFDRITQPDIAERILELLNSEANNSSVKILNRIKENQERERKERAERLRKQEEYRQQQAQLRGDNPTWVRGLWLSHTDMYSIMSGGPQQYQLEIGPSAITIQALINNNWMIIADSVGYKIQDGYIVMNNGDRIKINSDKSLLIYDDRSFYKP